MKKKLLPISVFALMLAVYLTPRYPVFAIDSAPELTAEQARALKPASNSAKPPKMSPAMERLMAQKEKQASKTAERMEKKLNRKEDLLEKLKTFKDQKKASVAARFNENLNKVNQQRTQQLSEHLTKMKDLLERLQSMVSGLTGDTAALNEQLTNTNALIKIAEASVSAQKAKDYNLTVTSESSVRLDAQSVKNSLQKDLEAVHKAVKNARKSLSDSISGIMKMISTSGGETNEQQ